MFRWASWLFSIADIRFAQRSPEFEGFCMPSSSAVHMHPTQQHQALGQTFGGLSCRSSSRVWRALLRSSASRTQVSDPARAEIECWLKTAVCLRTSQAVIWNPRWTSGRAALPAAVRPSLQGPAARVSQDSIPSLPVPSRSTPRPSGCSRGRLFSQNCPLSETDLTDI
jgi:hypothetical protein